MANGKIAFISNLKITLKKSIDSAYRKILCGRGVGSSAADHCVRRDVLQPNVLWTASEVVRDPVYQVGVHSHPAQLVPEQGGGSGWYWRHWRNFKRQSPLCRFPYPNGSGLSAGRGWHPPRQQRSGVERRGGGRTDSLEKGDYVTAFIGWTWLLPTH